MWMQWECANILRVHDELDGDEFFAAFYASLSSVSRRYITTHFLSLKITKAMIG